MIEVQNYAALHLLVLYQVSFAGLLDAAALRSGLLCRCRIQVRKCCS